MYNPDGNELVVYMKDPDGFPATLTLDQEDYARLLNKGWTVVEETGTFHREQITEEMFRQAGDRPTGGSHADIHS